MAKISRNKQQLICVIERQSRELEEEIKLLLERVHKVTKKGKSRVKVDDLSQTRCNLNSLRGCIRSSLYYSENLGIIK